jgi:hypothetical protein
MVGVGPAFAQDRLDQLPSFQETPDPLVMVTEFDIPAQPLDLALKSFGLVTRIELFYESSLTIGHRSFPVHGEMAAGAALRLLLKGTGLSITSFDHDTATILPPVQTEDAATLTQAKAKAVEFSPYLAMIQESLSLAFCRTPAAPTDPDDLLAQLWISPSGAVSRAELLSTIGSEQRHHAYKTMLSNLAIAAPPPAGMPQPVSIMILTRKSREAAGCPRSANAMRPVTHE